MKRTVCPTVSSWRKHVVSRQNPTILATHVIEFLQNTNIICPIERRFEVGILWLPTTRTGQVHLLKQKKSKQKSYPIKCIILLAWDELFDLRIASDNLLTLISCGYPLTSEHRALHASIIDSTFDFMLPCPFSDY